MKNYFKYLLLSALVFVSFTMVAQRYEKAIPSIKSYRLPLPGTFVLHADTVHFNNTLTNGAERFPLKAGITLPLDGKAIVKKGKWSRVAPGHFVWRVALQVPSAVALNIYFTGFNLGTGDKLFIYSADTKYVLGAFTQLNNAQWFATGLVDNAKLIVEFNTVKKTETLPFVFSEIGVIGRGERGFGEAGSCEVPVNCEEGQNWQHQKRGVARILVKRASSLFWCTGSLINNTANDGKPYFLTANHCGQGATAEDYNQWLFDFDFESPDCSRPASEPEKHTFTGAKLVANGYTPRSANSDFKLLLLNEQIPDEYHMFFNGWDRSGNVPQQGVVIHHPSGDIKFISTYTQPAISSFYYGAENSNGPFWKVYWSETTDGHGVTEGGSSGSPLFNEEGYIVGALTGGNASCSNNTEPDYFGKLSQSWDQNGTQDFHQLKPWLDPGNTGATKWEGYFKGDNVIMADFSARVTKITQQNYLGFYNLSEGNISQYRWEFEGGTPATSTEKNPGLVYYQAPGTYAVKLVVSSIDNVDSLIRENYITVVGNIYPNPFVVQNGTYRKIHILTGDTPLDNAEVYISDITGRMIEKLIPQTDKHEIVVNPNNLSSGTYLITTLIDGKKTTYKLAVINAVK